MRTVIRPYKRFSAGARALSEEMHVPIRLRDMPLRGCIINWGNSGIIPNQRGSVVINRPETVAVASNKLALLQACPEFGVPFTTDREEALLRLSSGAWGGVCARRILNGHSGNGLSIHTDPDNVPHCRLYTSLIRGFREWRVFFVGTNITTIYRKCRRDGDEPQDDNERRIRSTAHGWVFVDKPVDQVRGALLSQISDACREVSRATGLDFGAVDIIQDECSGKLFTLEVNTAPGLFGRTTRRMAKSLAVYAGPSFDNREEFPVHNWEEDDDEEED